MVPATRGIVSAGTGVEVSAISAASNSWFGGEKEGRTLLAASAFGTGGTIVLTGTTGGVHTMTSGSGVWTASKVLGGISGWIRVIGARTRYVGDGGAAAIARGSLERSSWISACRTGCEVLPGGDHCKRGFSGCSLTIKVV